MDEWRTDPWTLTDINNRFYGNGAACGKGPLMAWLHAIQAFKLSKTPLPVNLKFIIESMNHQNSEGLADFVATRSQDFFAGVSLVVECDSEWLGSKIPCIIYGTVGMYLRKLIEYIPQLLIRLFYFGNKKVFKVKT